MFELSRYRLDVHTVDFSVEPEDKSDWVWPLNRNITEYIASIGYIVTQVATPQSAINMLESTMVSVSQTMAALGDIRGDLVIYKLGVRESENGTAYFDEVSWTCTNCVRIAGYSRHRNSTY